jgi:hypothetical protein
VEGNKELLETGAQKAYSQYTGTHYRDFDLYFGIVVVLCMDNEDLAAAVGVEVEEVAVELEDHIEHREVVLPRQSLILGLDHGGDLAEAGDFL